MPQPFQDERDWYRQQAGQFGNLAVIHLECIDTLQRYPSKALDNEREAVHFARLAGHFGRRAVGVSIARRA